MHADIAAPPSHQTRDQVPHLASRPGLAHSGTVATTRNEPGVAVSHNDASLPIIAGV